ncbi:RNA polymerase sigma factor [Cellulophaga sp. E16_2]|uniref:RNA polymerase sigma factor n=1 Tax=Cellulophaga algicola (strain DSM 14237 / IC166 / ACAM 630) TaxID=688270 RepID=E6X872_CELAD|nr:MULTISPECIES: RNA polymerase sigma factor [Cellulophaga]ADV49698.1 RNA polymerase, sigma-24 subunit, ECF subfamily [Cellulophaga algicola DSM 14237]MBO0592153.1 RNA polymerase sigma factor [Cellulophaga sp. E16_2]
MSNHQDQYYIDKTLRGDAQSFSILIDRYKHMVFTVAFKVTSTRENAEEVAQDTFVKAYHSLATFKGESKFSTWIYKIAYYGALDYLKKNNRRIKTSTITSDHDINISELTSVLDQFEMQDRREIIKESLEQLGAEESVLVTLHYFKELSLQEISEIMNIPANTIKVRLFRIRKKLADILENKLTPETIKSYGRK